MDSSLHIRGTQKLQHAWKKSIPFLGLTDTHLYSAKIIIPKLLQGEHPYEVFIKNQIDYPTIKKNDFIQFSASPLGNQTRYSKNEITQLDKQLTDHFHTSLFFIVEKFPKFMDQLRFVHYSQMEGNESLFLYPSQLKRLNNEGVERIAGEVRTIQTGFGEYRFNGPNIHNVHKLLTLYCEKIEQLICSAQQNSIYNFVSFAQLYFTYIHPFYERCGRTSEELMYLLFQQTFPEHTRYISKTGWRNSPLALERMNIINTSAEHFNKQIGCLLGLIPEVINKTPDIYRELTRVYFPDTFQEIYASPTDRPYYYQHPIPAVLQLYYLAMQSLLHDRISRFSHAYDDRDVKLLGLHLAQKGSHTYTFQPENRTTS